MTESWCQEGWGGNFVPVYQDRMSCDREGHVSADVEQ